MSSSNSPQRMNWYETILFLLVIGLPLAFYIFQPRIPPLGKPMEVNRVVGSAPSSEVQFAHECLVDKPHYGQQYAHVGLHPSASGAGLDVIAADARLGQVVRLERGEDGLQWNTTVLGKDIGAPVRVASEDLDSDGDQDLIVSCAGSIESSDFLLGKVVWLENNGGSYQPHTILRHVRRVTDAQCGDFDSDGDLDVVVAVIGGEVQGQILLLENNGQQQFTDYELMSSPGTMRVPVRDFDGDGDLDFAAMVSGEDQQVWIFENDGKGFDHNRRQLAFSSTNFDLGFNAMIAEDLDQDGDQDLILTKGGSMYDTRKKYPKSWHGVHWLENHGKLSFESKQIAEIPGASGLTSVDLDGDGDLDLAVTSQFNDWNVEDAGSVFWLENDGSQSFKPWQIADDPIQVATIASGDIDGDGKIDLVTGSVQTIRPFEKFGSVDAFLNVTGTGDKQ